MVQLNSDVKSNAEWGFLKNIVNIDTLYKKLIEKYYAKLGLDFDLNKLILKEVAKV